MELAKKIAKVKKIAKTRGTIWGTENIPYNLGKYGSKGNLLNAEASDCTHTRVLEETTKVKVPADLYQRTADFMRNDIYDVDTETVIMENAASVWQVPQGRVYTNQPSQYFVFNKDGKVVTDVSYKYQDAKAGKTAESVEVDAKFFPEPEKFSGRVVTFVLGGGPSINIYHWMMDALPRLKLLEGIYSLDDIDAFVLQGKGYQDWIDTLELLGVERSRIHIRDQQLIHFQADELIAMTHPRGRLSNVTPQWAIDFHRDTYLPKIPERAEPWPEKIYISRKDSSLRGVVNEDELVEYLESRGYVEIVLTQLTYAEKVGCFHYAREIVSMSGAGFAFLAYTQPGAKVIELIPSGFVHYANYLISAQVDLDHRYLIFGDTSTGKHAHNAQRQELVVDLKRLEQELEAD